MDIIFYSEHSDESERRVHRALEQLGLSATTQVCGTTQALHVQLCEPQDSGIPVVISVGGRSGLKKLSKVRELLFGFRLVLLMPTGNKADVALGHTFRPRVMLDADATVSEIAAVLVSMTRRARSPSLVGG